MGEKFQKETQIHKIDFLNHHQNKYVWDNENLDDIDNALVEAKVSKPHLTAEIPGVDLASETPRVSQGISREYGEIDITQPIQEQLLQSSIHNNSLSIAGPDRTPGATLVNFANDRDNVASSQECGVLPNSEPKREPKVAATTEADLNYASDDG